MLTLTQFAGCSQEQEMQEQYTGAAFNPQEWKAYAQSQEADNPRAAMVSDLKTRYLKPGMTRVQVEALLGPADRERNGQFLYRLGMGRFSADYSYLAIVYDSSGRLTEMLDTRS
ncbi:MAG: hypothetical protein ABW095_17365 [Candidatus Thiodiazotropha sp.]